MEMKLYQGSQYVTEYPQPWLGRKNNDYGQGFYCSKEYDFAAEWAVGPCRDGYVNNYSLDTDGLKVLDLLCGEYHILNWLAMVLKSRVIRTESDFAEKAVEYIVKEFSVTGDDADIIIGYAADDSKFGLICAFLEGRVSLEQFAYIMSIRKGAEMVALRGRSAFGSLNFEGAQKVYAAQYYPKRLAADEALRTLYMEEQEPVGTYVKDILEQEWGNEDERLQRIVR